MNFSITSMIPITALLLLLTPPRIQAQTATAAKGSSMSAETARNCTQLSLSMLDDKNQTEGLASRITAAAEQTQQDAEEVELQGNVIGMFKLNVDKCQNRNTRQCREIVSDHRQRIRDYNEEINRINRSRADARKKIRRFRKMEQSYRKNLSQYEQLCLAPSISEKTRNRTDVCGGAYSHAPFCQGSEALLLRLPR